VDTDYFRPSGSTEPDPYHLVFSGSMDWLPNDDAMKYFMREMLPRIRAACPETVLTIVGRKPFPSLTALTREHPYIRVTGQVDDVRPYMERASVYVMPLRIGGGTRLKAFEAMAMEKPIVSTSIGVEGLPIVHGTHALIADDPNAFADAVVRANFGWAPVAGAFMDACELARRRWKQQRGQLDARVADTLSNEASYVNPSSYVNPRKVSMS
jgi:glycosyltransferase involved in cell wall biosynthesis